MRTPSEAAGPGDEQVIEDLVDTLEANRSRCVGMAANMIGVGKRIIVFVDEDLGGRITVMLNPVITASDGAFDTQEGCLSLTGERRTLRYRRIEVNYEDRRFRARHATFTGWTAQIIPPRLVIAITMQLHRNRYDQFFFMCTGGVGVLSGVGVPCAGRLASLRGVGGVMLPAVGWLASLEVLSASVMCQRVAGWLR